jgi:hypothetical protein
VKARRRKSTERKIDDEQEKRQDMKERNMCFR